MKAKGKRILIVDDEAPIQRMLRKILLVHDYEVVVADTGEQAVEMVRMQPPDLVLLDLCLPTEQEGLDACVAIRKMTHAPIIVLSAVASEKHKIQALDLGADDYQTKPFHNEELLARVRACLRRTNPLESVEENTSQLLASDDGYIRMDVDQRQVRAGEHEVRLTPTEFELLRQLMLYAGKVLTHRSLLRAVWGPEYGEEADYLRVYVRQLRRKVEQEPSHPRYILTEPGIGYVFRVREAT